MIKIFSTVWIEWCCRQRNKVSVITNLSIDNVDIKLTIYFKYLYDKVVRLLSDNKYNLIEYLAHKIETSIRYKFIVVNSEVAILRPYVPINGILHTVEVQVHPSV